MFKQILRGHALLLAMLAMLALACSGGMLGPTTSGATTSSSTTTSSTSTLTTATTAGESDPSDSGCSFIDCFDGGITCASSPATAGSRCGSCDLWAQDCPTETKCAASTNDGSDAWNTVQCAPVGPNKPGEPCTVEGSLASGVDSCELGAMCWHLDAETNMGTCVSLCEGNLERPSCLDPGTSCMISNDEVITLCLPRCDPLLQDCTPGEKCTVTYNGPFCVRRPNVEHSLGEPCESSLDCNPGLYCVDGTDFPGCDGRGCCSPYCDHTKPNDCPGAPEQSCVPWYTPEQAPEGYEHVGTCAIP